DTIGLAPVAGAPAVTLTRVADAASPGLARARTSGTRFRSIGVSWSDAGGVESLCLGNVVVTSFASRLAPSGGRAVEHATLLFGAAARAPGASACGKLPAGGPVAVRLYTDPKGGGLHARVDCLISRCRGTLRVSCPTEGCPAGGLGVGAFDLGAGQEALLSVRLGHSVRGRHPRMTATTTLAGRPGAVVAAVVVDPPAPAGLPRLTSTNPVPAPAGAPGSAAPGGPAGTGGGGSGGGGAAGGGGPSPGGATTPGGSAGPGSFPDSDSGSFVGSPFVEAPGNAIDTGMTLTCVGPDGSFGSVDGALSPGIAGAAVEIDYVPVDASLNTVVHQVTTGPGGRFADTSGGTPFVRAIGFYAGDENYVGSQAYCP
ncbi:MAG: hypothetical protein QOE27_2441, partial [Solirubrobacteraceae bacterium]|nr:hypothetical protein [Solirubrobacteraceae bacterium]